MAQQVKQLTVRLNGEVSKGVNEVGDKLEWLGSLFGQISGKTSEFQKESLNIYRAYEDNMLAAKFALSSQYTSATQLSRVMDTLKDSAETWASTTIFHTDDVSQAINEAAHAGWSLEEIMEGVPDAMTIAQARMKTLGPLNAMLFLMERLALPWSMSSDMLTWSLRYCANLPICS